MAIIFQVLHAELNLLWAIALVLSKTKYFIHVFHFVFRKREIKEYQLKELHRP